MKTIVKRLVTTHPAAVAEVAQFCRAKADTILNPGRIGVPWWGLEPSNPADELWLATNDLDADHLIELAEYIESLLPPAMRAAA